MINQNSQSFYAERNGVNVIVIRVQNYDKFANYDLIPTEEEIQWTLAIFEHQNRSSYLPKLYAALRYCTGDHDDFYDPWKGSFNFSFTVEIKKNNISHLFLVQITHYRDFIRACVYEIVDKQSPNRNLNVIQKFPEDVCTSKEFALLVCSYLKSITKQFEESGITPKLFCMHADSNHTLFGYSNQGYYYHENLEEEDYKNLLKNFCET